MLESQLNRSLLRLFTSLHWTVSIQLACVSCVLLSTVLNGSITAGGTKPDKLLNQPSKLTDCWFTVGSAVRPTLWCQRKHLIQWCHQHFNSKDLQLVFVSEWTDTMWLILHDSSTESTRRAQRFPEVRLSSSIRHTWTPYLWSVHEQQLLLHPVCSQ